MKINYRIVSRIGKTNRCFFALITFPLIVEILPVNFPLTITIITRGAPLIILVIVGCDGCFKIFGILNNRIISNPFWKLICGLLGWVATRYSYLWPALFIDMSLLATLVTSHIWLERWPSSRTTTISDVADLEVNLLEILVDLMINGHIVCLLKWMLVLILIISSRRLPPLWIEKSVLFTRSLFYKRLMGDDLIWWYYIYITHTKFLDKLRNLLVLMNPPKT